MSETMYTTIPLKAMKWLYLFHLSSPLAHFFIENMVILLKKVDSLFGTVNTVK